MTTALSSEPISSLAPNGHVFVVRSDIRYLACDAWMLPTDDALRVVGSWFDSCPFLARRRGNPSKSGQTDDSEFLLRLEPHDNDARVGPYRVVDLGPAGAEDAQPASRVYAVGIGATETAEDEWFLDGLEAFVRLAAKNAEPHRGRWRARPLLAVPPVGTRAAGRGDDPSELVQKILVRLEALAKELSVDLALVARVPDTYAWVQHVRRGAYASASIPPEVRKQVMRLASHARRGGLVPFLGAGASRGAGAPDWRGLLSAVASELPHPVDPASLGADLPEAFAKLEAPFKDLGDDLKKRVAALLDRFDHHSLVQALCADLECEAGITTNFDRLYESALTRRLGIPRGRAPASDSESAQAPPPLAVLAHRAYASADRWLLQMHGSTENPPSLVLTTKDYASHAEESSALLGLVQASLMTKHLLFVGYSRTDKNFQDACKSVARALSRQSLRDSATALLLEPAQEAPAPHEDFEPISFAGVAGGPLGAARDLEVFLDLVVLDADSSVEHFLSPRYDRALEPSERALKQLLLELADYGEAHPDIRSRTIWRPIEEALRRLGLP